MSDHYPEEDQLQVAAQVNFYKAVDGIMELVKVRYRSKHGVPAPNQKVHDLEQMVKDFVICLIRCLV